MALWQIYLLEFPFQESESHKCELKSLWLTIYCELHKLTMKKILFCLLWYLLLGVRTFRRGRYYQNDNNVIETVLRLCTQSSR